MHLLEQETQVEREKRALKRRSVWPKRFWTYLRRQSLVCPNHKAFFDRRCRRSPIQSVFRRTSAAEDVWTQMRFASQKYAIFRRHWRTIVVTLERTLYADHNENKKKSACAKRCVGRKKKAKEGLSYEPVHRSPCCHFIDAITFPQYSPVEMRAD